MKASLYVVHSELGWRPMWSIAMEMDVGFWLEDSFRNEVIAVQMEECVPRWGMAGDTDVHVLEERVLGIIGWREPLSLGLAEKACRLLAIKLRRLTQFAKSLDVANDLRQTVREVQAEDTGGQSLRECDENTALVPEIWSCLKGESRSASLELRKSSDLDLRMLARSAQIAGERLRGRALLSSEVEMLCADLLPELDAAMMRYIVQLAALLGYVQLTAGIGNGELGTNRTSRGSFFRFWKARTSAVYCLRCGGGGGDVLHRSLCASCGRHCLYCEQCITMGRTRECGLLVLGTSSERSYRPSQTAANRAAPISEHWGLSPAQTEAAAEALRFIRSAKQDSSLMSRTFLLWAVTGAGKTEMIFPLIDEVIQREGRVVVATPRRDVVLELAPRLAVAFPDQQLAVLYGGSPDRFGMGQITLATTHQLLRCYKAFDLVIIDELDAYPYHNNPMLHYAAAKSRKLSGITVLLSATPPSDLQREAVRRRLPHARVPVRFHLCPLPVPVRVVAKPLSYWLRKANLPPKVLALLKRSADRGAQLFVFVPFIRDVDNLVKLLISCAHLLGLPPAAIEGTSSRDTSRSEKVNSFRNRTIRLLVTTTILERGVTVPQSDVFVVGADNPQFDSAALVQMAGRAGRSADDPYGYVYFVGKEMTISQRGAIRQIRGMNAIATKKGYLKKRQDPISREARS